MADTYRCPRLVEGCQCGALYCIGDHKPDLTGLDDGPELRPARKKPEPKPLGEVAAIRAQAWETRRAKYGAHGHG